MVKSLPEFEYFAVFLKNRKIISKIRRSKITDCAALTFYIELSSNFVGVWLNLALLKDK